MNTRISSSTSRTSFSGDDAPAPAALKKNSVAILKPARFLNTDSNTIGSSHMLPQEPLTHVADVTSHTAEADSHMSPESITEAFDQSAKNLAPFLVAGDENALSQIFVFNEKRDQIELHENTLETSLTMEASHEAVKDYLVDELTTLYGEAAVNVLYPEKERSQPLTLGKAQDLIKSFSELQNSVVTACDGDFSKYDTCLAAQLKTLEELKTAVANPRPASPIESSTIEYLSKQTGLPAYMISAGLIAGGVLAAGALTSGLAFPVAVHAAMMTALAHPPLLGATAGGASHLTAAVGGVANANTGGQALTGIWMGMSTGVVNAHYGTAALTALSNISAPTAVGAGTGAFVGAIGGGIVTAGSADNPASTGKIIAGMLAGAALGSLLGGLSVAFTPSTVGGSIAGGGGAIGALGGTITGGRAGGTMGALRGAARGAATGIAAGGAVMLFGGLCSAVATASTAATVTTGGAAAGITTAGGYKAIGLGTAVTGYVAASTEINNAVSSAIGSARNTMSNTNSQGDRPNPLDVGHLI